MSRPHGPSRDQQIAKLSKNRKRLCGAALYGALPRKPRRTSFTSWSGRYCVPGSSA
jgi:hypothetical protein